LQTLIYFLKKFPVDEESETAREMDEAHKN